MDNFTDIELVSGEGQGGLEEKRLRKRNDPNTESEVLKRIEQDPNAEYDETHGLFYSLEEEPPWYLTILISLQHYLTMASSTVSTPLLLAPVLCMQSDDINLARLCSTIMFISGICTLIQTTLGTRLPIVQGSSFAFLIPIIAIMKTKFKCPLDNEMLSMSDDVKNEVWQIRIREIQGAIIVGSLVEMAFGLFGIIGMILKYVTPLTVASAITMIGLSLFRTSARSASSNWWIALLTILLIVIFSQYCKRVKVTLPNTSSRHGGFPILEIFPVITAMVLVWFLCWILTITDVLPKENKARTDLRLPIIHGSPWIEIPYPFQWGLPTITLGSILGIMCSVFTGTVESIGDYIACSEIVGSDRPPASAMNRGIFMEGFGLLLCGLFGTGTGTTSYSQSIGALALTRVGSRSVIQGAALFMILFGMIGKIGAFFVTIPDPIIGGVFCVLFGTIMAIGLSNLGDVDLKSQRNLFIIGFSIFFSLTVSEWISENPDSVNTGSEALDQILQILLRTGMFLSGTLGFILDNTIPGTPEERGLVAWSSQLNKNSDAINSNKVKSYEFPKGMETIRRFPILKRLPISPTYGQ